VPDFPGDLSDFPDEEPLLGDALLSFEAPEELEDPSDDDGLSFDAAGDSLDEPDDSDDVDGAVSLAEADSLASLAAGRLSFL